jgi:uncharacterized protein with HEPN domain
VRSDLERLADILDAARKIAIKVSDGQDVFMRDEYVQLALAHLVQIIGEAAARLSDNVTSRNPEIPWRQIIAMRNSSYTATSMSTPTSSGPSCLSMYPGSRTRSVRRGRGRNCRTDRASSQIRSPADPPRLTSPRPVARPLSGSRAEHRRRHHGPPHWRVAPMRSPIAVSTSRMAARMVGSDTVPSGPTASRGTGMRTQAGWMTAAPT